MSIDKLSQKIVSQSALPQLVSDSANRHVGYVYAMGYDEAKILTNDAWRARVGGIQLNAFLVACSFDPTQYDKANDLERREISLNRN